VTVTAGGSGGGTTDGPRSPLGAAAGARRHGPRRVRSAVLLAVGGVALYLLLPTLLAVLGSWRSLSDLAWPFAIVALACEVVSFACVWQLLRIALRSRAWFPVVTAQLSANAVARVVPGGGVTATALATSLLRTAGFRADEAAAGLTAAAGLQVGARVALPALALPAMVGGAAISPSLAAAAYLGAAVLAVLVAAGAAAFASDVPLELAGRAIQWLLNATVRRSTPVADVPETLLAARDVVRGTLGSRWQEALLAAAGNAAFDYLALLAALRAVGAEPQPSLVLLAYTSATLLALIPVTPGGLGFVEAGLAGTLTLAGVPAQDALAATLLYRIISFWLPLPAGAAAYLLFRRRYGNGR
jgi:uncharacterized protein (TIRG00374 family)